MTKERIEESLNRVLHEENNNIIFWYDEEQEFVDLISELALGEIQLLDLREKGLFEIKLILEESAPDSKFLIYAPSEKPSPEKDWLLDCYHYSYKFSADSASMIRDELGFKDIALKDFIKKHQSFFNSKKRKESLAKLVQPSDNSETVSRKMLQVLFNAPYSNTDNLLLSFFKDSADQKDYLPPSWADIEKHGLADNFWEIIESEFGYKQPDREPLLKDLLYYLAITEVSIQANDRIPAPLKKFVIKASHKASHIRVFMSDWRDKDKYRESYIWHLQQIENELKIEDHLGAIELADLLQIETFEAVEKHILRNLKNLLLDGSNSALARAEEIIETRSTSFWFSQNQTFAAIYKALSAVLSFIRLKETFGNHISITNAPDFFNRYTEELYNFDYFYRQFQTALNTKGVKDCLPEIREKMECLYSEWYFSEICSSWGKSLESGFINTWKIDNVPCQYSFYNSFIQLHQNSTRTKRIAVIISDAFRYEAATDLCTMLNEKDNFKASIQAMLGVLPSYTNLGMASLLPHKTLSIDTKESILVDGLKSAGVKNRQKILEQYNGVAIKAHDLTKMSQNERRSFIGDSMLVYIYHDRIDETGDSGRSEHMTFQAVAETLKELDELSRNALNSLNCSTVIITADHGFSYSETSPFDSGKAELKHLTGDRIKETKRFVLGTGLHTESRVLKTKTTVSAGTSTVADVICPLGFNTFNFIGGAKFFHGGAMPQEIVIPVVICKKYRDKAAEKVQTRKVGISSLININKITSLRHTFKFIQNEWVTDKVLPVTVQVGFYDEENNPVSDKHTLIFDATEDKRINREQAVTFTFKNINYDPNQNYLLLIEDERRIELNRYVFRINILIPDEFDGF